MAKRMVTLGSKDHVGQGWRNAQYHLRYSRGELPPNYPVPALHTVSTEMLCVIAATPTMPAYDFADIGRFGQTEYLP